MSKILETLCEIWCVIDHLGHHYRPSFREIAYLETEGIETTEQHCLFCSKERKVERKVN